MKSWPLQFPPPAGHHRIARGLELRVHDRGASWVFRYTFNGKRREHGLGAFLAVTKEQAERALASVLDKWEALRSEVDAGRDPIQQRDAARHQAKVEELRRRTGTLLKVARQYHEACVEPLVSTKYAHQWTQEFERDVPVWLLNLPAEDVSALDILRAVGEMPGGLRGNKARQRLEQVCEWMIRHGKVASNAAGVRRNTRDKWIARLDMGRPSLGDAGSNEASAA